MHVATSSGTPTGAYTVRLTGTSGLTTHTFDVQVAVGSPIDFTITSSTPSRTVTRGTITSYSVTVTAQGGFAETVNLSCSGVPVGTACGPVAGFVPSALGTTKSISFIVGTAAVPGTYSFQFKGVSATKQHAVTVQLTIN
jgi:hypothetical protein